ncbi:hypothetical protein C8Q79DRAFT_366239 [Trametes meyenii]|nr:hypothetical protein C8Q79DRAFT_366239 [Trametes meyenii]
MDSLQTPMGVSETLTPAATLETDVTVMKDVGAACMRAAPLSVAADADEKNVGRSLTGDSEDDGEIPPRFVEGNLARDLSEEKIISTHNTIDHLYRLLADFRSEVPESSTSLQGSSQCAPSNNGFFLKRSYHYDRSSSGGTLSSPSSTLERSVTPQWTTKGPKILEQIPIPSPSPPSSPAASRNATFPPTDVIPTPVELSSLVPNIDRNTASAVDHYPDRTSTSQATLSEVVPPSLNEFDAKAKMLGTASDIGVPTLDGAMTNEGSSGLNAHTPFEGLIIGPTMITRLGDANPNDLGVTKQERLGTGIFSTSGSLMPLVSYPSGSATEDLDSLEVTPPGAESSPSGSQSQTIESSNVTPSLYALQEYVSAKVPATSLSLLEPSVLPSTPGLLTAAIISPETGGSAPIGISTTIEHSVATENTVTSEDAMATETLSLGEAHLDVVPGLVEDSAIVRPCLEAHSATGDALTGPLDPQESFGSSLSSSSTSELGGILDGGLNTGDIPDSRKLLIISPADPIPDTKMLSATTESPSDDPVPLGGGTSTDPVVKSGVDLVTVRGPAIHSDSTNTPSPCNVVADEAMVYDKISPSSPLVAALLPLSSRPLSQLPSSSLNSNGDSALENASPSSMISQPIPQSTYDFSTLDQATGALVETRLSGLPIDTTYTTVVQDLPRDLEDAVVTSTEQHDSEILISSDNTEHRTGEDDALLNLPPSSPPRSSSPPQIFSSSPPGDLSNSPPSSSPPLLPLDDTCLNGYGDEAASLAPSEVISTYETPATVEDERPAKRLKTDPSSSLPDGPPLPKRPTQASAAKQRKKLAAPFRSPVIKGPLAQGGLHVVYSTGRALIPPPPRKDPVSEAECVTQRVVHVKPDPAIDNRDRTANVAKQFKSPLVTPGSAASSSSAASGSLFSTVKAMPTIQTLQGKVQTLKQAIRIKNAGREDGEDDLERLVKKWTAAGREVAWAVWDYVKDLDPGTSAVSRDQGGWSSGDDGFWGKKTGEKRAFDPGWGYDDEHAIKRMKLEDGVEEDARVKEDETAPIVQHTLGTMLRHLSIDPTTLGWDEEEGDFVDA